MTELSFGPNLDGTSSVFEPAATVLSDLQDELSTPVDVEMLRLRVPNRPKYKVMYLPDMDFDMMRLFMRRSQVGKSKQFSELLFSFQILSHTNRGLMREDLEITDSDGQPMLFASRELQTMLGASDLRGAIRKMYGMEGHIIAASNAVMEAAGFGDTDMQEDDEDFPLDASTL